MENEWIKALREGTYGFEDTPAEKDALGLDQYIKGLTQFIGTCPTPMTIAIQGSWGTGKTSAMNMIKAILADDPQVSQIEFNTWQYARIRDDDLFLPLLQRMEECIREEIDQARGGGEVTGKIRKNLNKVKSQVVNSVAGALGTAIEALAEKGQAVLQLFVDTAKAAENARQAGKIYEYVEKLKGCLDTGIRFLEENFGISRIIFYIDDLDRLEPEVAVTFLEDMKNLFMCKNCVFVLALDHEIVQRGIQRRYGFAKKQAVEYSARFFDKLIQLPFSLPCHRYNVEQYVGSLLNSGEKSGELARLIRLFGDTNPRSIKRIFNIMKLYINLGDAAYAGHEEGMMALLLLQMHHGKLFEGLVKAVSEDLSDPEVSFLRAFGDADVSFAHTDEWFGAARDEADARIVEELKNLVMVEGPAHDRYERLFSLVGAASLTGEGAGSVRARLDATVDLITRYLKRLEYDPGENNAYFSPADQNVKVIVSLPGGGSPDHVNLDITAPQWKNPDAAARRQLVADLISACFGKEEPIAIVSDDNIGTMGAQMDILCNWSGVICLRNVSAGEARSMRLAGFVLRQLAGK